MSEPKLETKGEFAARLNVTPGRLSQMLAAGKVPKDALVGEGRRALIDVDRAMASLDRTLDLSQRSGTNGRVRITASVTEPPADAEPAAPTDAAAFVRGGVDEELRRESLEQKRIETRRMIRAEAASAGDLVAASEVRAATDKIVRRMVEAVDQVLIEMAANLAGEFSLSRRDLLHSMRRIWREKRAEQSDAFQAEAAEAPTESEATVDLQ